MPDRRKIDERDVDRLLAALTDTQIASLYGMSELEVHELRRSRRTMQPKSHGSTKKDGKTKS